MCLEQEHKPRSKNTKLKSKNHKPINTITNPATDLPSQPNKKATNTNPTIDFSCQPNTKTTSTNPNTSKNTNTNPAIHLQKPKSKELNMIKELNMKTNTKHKPKKLK